MLSHLVSPFIKTVKIGLACTLLASTAALASDPELTLKIGPEQKWGVSHSEIQLEHRVTAEDGLVLKFEPVPPPKINYISATVPWEFEVPNNAKVRVEVRAEEERGCYIAIRLVGTDGQVYEAVLSGDPTVGYKVSETGSVAEIPISDFKTKDGFKLEPGTQIVKASIIVAPDRANTLYFTSIAIVPNAQ